MSDLQRDAARFSTRIIDRGSAALDTSASSGFHGRRNAHEVASGLFSTSYDITSLQEQMLTMEVGASLTCSILLDGDSLPMEVVGHQPISQFRHVPTVIGFGQTSVCRSRWFRGQRCFMGGFSLRPSFFDRFGDAVADDGLAALFQLMKREHSALHLPLSTKLTQLAAASLVSHYTGEMEALFLESNTLASVIEVATLLRGEEKHHLPRRHRSLLERARERLDADLVSPPNTIVLVKDVGTNVTTLQRLFREELGTTIHGYVQAKRLEVARLLLRERVGSVAEVGRQVGYTSAAAFTAAYRRRFGYPPSSKQ